MKVLVGMCVALVVWGNAHAAEWPARPVRVVVPFAPGGATDVVARLVSPRLSEEFGQQFVVDNRAGAGGTIGTEIVARANPDGYTINIGASSYASSAALYKLTYDPMIGMQHVTLITRGPLVLSPHTNTGRIRGLAVTSEQRSKILPDLPAINEVVPGYTAFTWFGMWVPPKTPKAIVAKLNESIGRILKRPDVLDRLRADGMELGHNAPEEFARFVAADIAKWNKVVKAGNIRVD